LGLSAATVSLALRDSPRVLAPTKQRVLLAARRAGYRPNPLVASVMTVLRRSSHGGFQGALMAVNYSASGATRLIPYHREVMLGAERRATELGYSLSLCWVGPRLLTLPRLNAIVATRNIRGLVVLPFAESRDFSALDWSRVAGVVMDYCLSTPQLHTVLPDHQASLFMALQRLAALGYRRPGLMIQSFRDERLMHRWSAGFLSSGLAHRPEKTVPVLAQSTLTREAFCTWYERHRPDVVIAHHHAEVTAWLRSLGRHVPRDVGFLALNATECNAPCAALDLQPALLGAAAVESVVAQLQRNEHGIPVTPKTITLPARWVDGPTLRPVR
jgi:LacI family transcriptional regulator